MDIFTTMITPYMHGVKVDYDTAERYVDWYFENGLNGIFAVCHSSEIFYLSLEERVELNRRVNAPQPPLRGADRLRPLLHEADEACNRRAGGIFEIRPPK